jgi:hypothetical protein
METSLQHLLLDPSPQALTLSSLHEALLARRVFATRSPTLLLVLVGNTALMGSRLELSPHESLTIGVWCDDQAANRGHARLELWTTGATSVAAYETRGLHQVSWQQTITPRGPGAHWFVVRVLHGGSTLAYSSPIWARWQAG